MTRSVDALGLVAGWPVEGAAVGVLCPSPTGGGGLVRWEVLDSVGPAHRAHPWASVTKPATALAVLVAVEEGTLALDEPAGPPGSTVAHLLAHASGLGPDGGPPLAPPATSRIYSNAGYVVLADLLSRRSGMPFADYLRDGVLEPLGMGRTVLEDVPAGAAAAGLSGPLADLLALGREWAAPTLVSAVTHGRATAAWFPELGGTLPGFRRFDPCPWGLGVEIRGAKQPHWTGRANDPATFGHFGRSGSFLWVDPVDGVAMAGLGGRPFGAWSTRHWPLVADAVLAELGGSGRSGGADHRSHV